MKFYDKNGITHDSLTSVLVTSIGSKILQTIDNIGETEETVSINMPRNHSDNGNIINIGAPVDPVITVDELEQMYEEKYPNGYTEEEGKSESIPGGKSASYPHVVYVDNYDNDEIIPGDDFKDKVKITKDEPFDFGSIDIDWERREINLINDKGVICQSTPISEHLVSTIGDIDPNSIPDPNCTESLNINTLIDNCVLGKENDTLLSILDNMSKGNVIGFKGTVIGKVLNLTEDITNKILTEYQVELPGGTKQGLVQTIITFLTNRIKYLYKDV